jgi:AICAR transformylase/IMP cyclohydrolase PurH
VIIVKHTNPCGAATGTDILEAYNKALACDPVSAFGSVIGINTEVDAAAAEEISKLFVEAIAAPGFTAEARARFAAKKNLRLVKSSRHLCAPSSSTSPADCSCRMPTQQALSNPSST